MADLIGRTILHYKITEKLGEGGMGVVYKAEDCKLKREVAIKFLPHRIAASEEERERFKIEAQAAAALNHPNIATIHAIEEVDDQMFIVMEYIEGQELREIVGAQNFVPLPEVLDYATQIASGLQAAHEKDITHRDIKSANIMITDKGQVKIMDFGLAKMRGGAQFTKVGTTLGTTAYMSPEQAQGIETDHRTDIWAFGVVLYEMLTGKLPFPGDYEQAVIYAILNEEPEPLTNIRSDVPTELQHMVQKAMQKDAGERYQQVKELLAEFKSNKKKIESKEVDADGEDPSPSIAVLPFVNMSADPENEYFSDGLSEELINALTKLEGLHVVARTSAFRFRGKEVDLRDVGKQLNVGTVLEGSVRKSGNRLRITAQLINVADGYHIWSERYDREMEDVFAIQDEISQAIVDTLEVQLLGKEKKGLVKRYTDNLEAYQLYLKGRYYFNKYTPDGPAKAIACYQQALQKDPNYTLAYCGLADIYGQLAYWGFARPKDVLPKNEEFGLKAVELDDMSDEAHTVLGATYAFTERDWAKAEAHLQRAIKLNPNSIEAHMRYALCLTSMGRFDEADVECKRSVVIDPLSPVAQSVVALNHFAQSQYDRTINVCTKSLELEPNFPIHHWMLWRAYALMRKYGKAVEACKKTFTFWGQAEVSAVLKNASKKSDYLAVMRKGAEQMIAQSDKRFISPHDIALFFAHADKKAKAVDWLEKSYQEREPRLHFLKVAPDFSALRKLSRFKTLLKKVGFEVEQPT